MSEPVTHTGVIPSANLPEQWLPPTEALDLFEPPAGFALAESSSEKTVRYGFQVASFHFLIKLGRPSEVLRRPDIWDLPGATPWLLGLVNLRSNLVPVFDLRRIFDLPPRESDATLVLVFDQGDKAVGIQIDDFPHPLLDLRPLPDGPQLPILLQPHVPNWYTQDSTIWLEFEYEAFFEALANAGQ